MNREDDAALDAAATRFARWRRIPSDVPDRRDPAAQRVAQVWERSGELAGSPAMEALRRQARAPRRRFAASVGWRRAGTAGASIAALASAAAIAAMLIPAVRPLIGAPALAPALPRIATAAGEQRRIVLPDGTTVRLDGRSALRLAYSDGERRVRLEGGRAFFIVRHDAARPFVVEAAGGETVDLGTRFTVDNEAGRVRVTLIEGAVTIRSGRRAAPITLVPGEQAGYADAAPPRRIARAPSDPLDWTRGVVTLDEMPLGEAVTLLSRYTDTPIVLGADPALRRREVTAVFRTDKSASYATTLASALSLKVHRRADGTAVLDSD